MPDMLSNLEIDRDDVVGSSIEPRPSVLELQREPVTMNDGCEQISFAACQEIWNMLGQSGSGPVATAFQARINGAKGVWFRERRHEASSLGATEFTININQSQRKFHPHREDNAMADNYDPIRWTFDVLRWSTPACPSRLPDSFIVIMDKQGVPRSTLEGLYREYLDSERERVLILLKEPRLLHSWIYSTFASKLTGSDIVVPSIQGLPRDYPASILRLLEAGFEPIKHRILAKHVMIVLNDHFSDVMRRSSIPLKQSTMLIGIADPQSLLEPGEIHVAFSSLLDRSRLEGDVLIARHPALRSSDIQKVTAVYKPELDYLVDVVVFSTRGPRPLASKLAGGDYDGDTYWVSHFSIQC